MDRVAGVNVRTRDGGLSSDVCCRTRKYPFVNLLVDKGADVQVMDNRGLITLVWVAEK